MKTLNESGREYNYTFYYNYKDVCITTFKNSYLVSNTQKWISNKFITP